MIYLDNSATTKPLPEAADAVDRCLRENFFNPASAYAPAVAAERAVEAARKRLGQALCCDKQEVVYTSGGTESNNAAILGALKAMRLKGRIITTRVEHPSVYEVFRMLDASGYETVYIGVDRWGRADKNALNEALSADTRLVSIMHINNETGAVNDLAALSALIKAKAPEAVFHSDGVQAFCKMPFAPLSCDLYTISGHKFHGPKGVGALYVKSGAKFAGGLIGGGQERGLRAGTTNVPGILGMDAALAAYTENQAKWLEGMYGCKERLRENLLSIPDVSINGPEPGAGAPHILNASFLGVRGEVLLHALEQEEIYVSTGSACSTHKKGKNRILAAMGVSGPREEGAIRFSLCPFNTIEEMDRAAGAIAANVATLRRFQRR